MKEFEYRFSSRKLPSGKYQLILAYKDGMKWRQKTRTCELAKETKSAALKKEMLDAVKSTARLDASRQDMTLLEFTDFWLSMRKDISINTAVAYRCRITALHALKDKKIREIEPVDILGEFAQMGNFAQATQQLAKSTLTNIFKAAVLYKVIASSPMTSVEIRTREQEKGTRLRTFTDEELKAAFSAFDHRPDYKIIVMICAYTGCRIAEALALTWQDIDFHAATVSIHRQWNRLSAKDASLHGFRPLKTKNGIRTIPIPPVLLSALAKYRAVSIRYIDGRLTGIKNRTIIGNEIRNRLPGHSAHDFRHTYATRLIAAGSDIQTVAALLGDTVAAVSDTYLHYTDAMRQRAAASIRSLFG